MAELGASDESKTEKPGEKLPSGLYVVATPIGNLGDLSRRGKETLAAADVVACEDTRVTAKLMTAFLMKKPLVPYHEHNGASMRPKLLERVRNGDVVVLVSDAGTPLISDPGYKLVEEAQDEGLNVVAVPGPSAVTTALSIAGLPTNRFLFMGFPPNKSKARQAWFAAEVNTGASLVFYESAKRLPNCIEDAAEVFGPRRAAVCRELTKKFEEVVRGDLVELRDRYAEIGSPKGEVVVVVEGPAKAKVGTESSIETERLLTLALEHMSVKSAASFVAEVTGEKRKTLYSRALELTNAS
jgi:16S rRNA (cytidine1402-2'-O)-methyltransferase